MSDFPKSSLFDNKVASCKLRNDDGTRLTKSMEIGSVTYLVVTMTEAGHRMCT